jgi:hypothetical protein
MTAGAVPASSARDGQVAGEVPSAGELLHASNGAELAARANHRMQEDAAVSAPPQAQLDREAIESLLAELTECRRILDGALHPRR